MGDIAGASANQSEGLAMVSSSIAEMNQVTQQNAALVEQAAAAAQSLQDQAENLEQVVGAFKLGNNPPQALIRHS